MSSAEYEDIQVMGVFRSVGNCLYGKWFAESMADALQWSILLSYPANVLILEISLEEDVSRTLYQTDYLDGVGPARYAEIDQLQDATILSVTSVV